MVFFMKLYLKLYLIKSFCFLNLNIYVCIMEIQTENKSIHVSRLCSLADYARSKNIAYTTAMHRMFKGKIESIKISGIDFIILNDDEMKIKGGK